MNNQSITIETDLNLIISTNRPYPTLLLDISGELNDPQMLQQAGIIPASVLLPPYEASIVMVDGDIMQFSNMYRSYLQNNPNAFEFILYMIKALYQGRSLVMYLSEEQYKLPYSKIILEVIGSLIGAPIDQFNSGFIKLGINIQPPITINVSRVLYVYNLIAPQEYLNTLSIYYKTYIDNTDKRHTIEFICNTLQINEQVVYKLASDMRPYINQSPTLRDVITYFCNLITIGYNPEIKEVFKGVY